MRVARSLSELRTYLPTLRPRPLWLVPTMGALHEGHGALVDRAKKEGGFVAVSIFVNPLQFGPSEDLSRYPRTESADLSFLEERGVDLVFLPSAQEMVPPGSTISVSSGTVGEIYCGASRPGHFDGVLTIVLKLFHLFSPNYAIFGEKDRQQLHLITAMVRTLNLPTTILGHPTVRESDGLAMSSRNCYLSTGERRQAGRFPELLDKAACEWANGSVRSERDIAIFQRTLTGFLEEAGFRVDYVALADRQTFLPLPGPSIPDQAILLAAIHLGSTRLIDNRELARERPGV